VAAEGNEPEFATCLLLAVAYSASIGGMATLIGTPPNLYVASYFSEVRGIDVGFLQWMAFGLPCAALLLVCAWFYLTRLRYTLSTHGRSNEVILAGPGLAWQGLDRGSRITLGVFAAVVGAWILRPFVAELVIFGTTPLAHLSDAGIALLGACALFVIPVDFARKRFVLDWPDTHELPWGTLILFGGGLSLAAAINVTGTDKILGEWIAQMPPIAPFFIVVGIVGAVVLLTELTSNIATTATLVPVLAAAAPLLGIDPDMVIVMVALAASCAFMLPVATPPNAIVFGSGRVSAHAMARAGIVMNVLGLLTISGLGYVLIPLFIN
jgi:sodium-dependent dicarboxylate transporter 2/3/5